MIHFPRSTEELPQQEEPIRLFLRDDGVFPNNDLIPLVVLRNAVSTKEGKKATERAFLHVLVDNGWEPQWKGSLYSYHHYHASTHEAIGVLNGSATVQFGGPGGPELEIQAGDMLIIPAGVAHCLKGSQKDFQVIGAYPPGFSPDMCFGEAGERPAADKKIKKICACSLPSYLLK
jgi:uncharacterized protein YjlB